MSYSIQVRTLGRRGEWVDAGRYPDTASTAVKHARLYAVDYGTARVLDRDTDQVVGTWERVGDHYVTARDTGDQILVKGKAKKVS